jgi:16S rRNA (guanine966-N2)-methyltransferase
MRIVAGIYRGRAVAPVPGEGTRPTTDRVREAMASSIASYLGTFEDIAVLDAFAGSGALGFEMLSRGASHVTFVELDSRAFKVVGANAAALGVPAERMALRRGDVMRLASQRALHAASPFGLALLDPPYACEAEDVYRLLDDLARADMLQDGALIVYERAATHAKGQVEEELAGWQELSLHASRRYGITEVDHLVYHKEDQ